jgi:SPP1 gp7 family putative phage head morphogenesis protein
MLHFKARPRKSPAESPALTASQRRMMATLGEAMQRVRDQIIRDEGKFLDAFMHSTLDKIVNMIPTQPWIDGQQAIQDELLGEVLDAGSRVKLPSFRKEVMEFRFDRARAQAAAWATKESALLVTNVVEEQRITIRDYASRASMGEFAPRQMARGLRDVVGLTPAQGVWVENFRAREIASRMAQGASFDQAFTGSEAATARYHARIHRYRTEMIARTEIMRAASEGREEAWAQGLEEGFISPLWGKQWVTDNDERTCDQCGSLDGFIIGLNEGFPDGDPPVHPACRCDVILVPSEEMETLAPSSDGFLSPPEFAALGLIGSGLLSADEAAAFIDDADLLEV